MQPNTVNDMIAAATTATTVIETTVEIKTSRSTYRLVPDATNPNQVFVTTTTGGVFAKIANPLHLVVGEQLVAFRIDAAGNDDGNVFCTSAVESVTDLVSF